MLICVGRTRIRHDSYIYPVNVFNLQWNVPKLFIKAFCLCDITYIVWKLNHFCLASCIRCTRIASAFSNMLCIGKLHIQGAIIVFALAITAIAGCQVLFNVARSIRLSPYRIQLSYVYLHYFEFLWGIFRQVKRHTHTNKMNLSNQFDQYKSHFVPIPFLFGGMCVCVRTCGS